MNKKKSFAEIIRYGVAGGTTTFHNIALYHVVVLLGLDYKVANFLAIICTKIYAYVINKLFVFQSHCSTKKELLTEISKFIGARGVTGIVDYAGLIVLVEVFCIDNVISKYIITFTIIVLNYILGKSLVFQKGYKHE